jgi:hypothetical protein
MDLSVSRPTETLGAERGGAATKPASDFTGGNGGMIFPLITRISADWMLQNPRPSAKSAAKSVVELDLWIEADSVLSVSSCKNARLYVDSTG